MVIFGKHFNFERIIPTIYGALNLNSLACFCLMVIIITFLLLIGDALKIYRFDIINYSLNMAIFFSSFPALMIIGLMSWFCSRTKETFESLNYYNFFGIFSELHVNEKRVGSRKMHAVLRDVPVAFQNKPNKKFVLIHTFAGVYEKLMNDKLLIEKFDEKPVLYKSYIIPWVYVVGLICISIDSTRGRYDLLPKSKRPVTRFIHLIRRIHRESLCYSMPLVRFPPSSLDPR